MTTDLWMLFASGAWSAMVFLIYAFGRFSAPGGIAWAFGNRDTPFEVAPWVARAVRAHQHLTENMTFFAILVLVAHVAGKANAMTALGAEIFFIARVAHTLLYTAGIAYLRTAAFSAALIGEIIIAVQLFN